MSKITYRRIPVKWGQPLLVVNEMGLRTTFSDHLAYSAFVLGLDKLRAGGCDVSLTDEEGFLIVGDFSNPANKVPLADQSTRDFQAFWAANRDKYSSFGAAQEAWLNPPVTAYEERTYEK